MATSPRIAVIVLAAGTGVRLGYTVPKAFVTAGGRTLLSLALEPVFAMRERPQVIVTAPQSYLPQARQIAEIVPGRDGIDLTVMAGGETRQESVAAALVALADSVEVVLVHDAARPLTPSVIFDSIAAEVAQSGVGAIPGLPVTDTIKRIDEDGVVNETLDRSELTTIQTPQGFPREHLVAAHSAGLQQFTDDAALVAASGYPVAVIAGDQLGFKITTAWDLRLAESTIANALASATVRVGTGVDVHAFSDDPTRTLRLGCIDWPGEPGLEGHSDGDVIAHAMCDAMLSAARLGDMGTVFGTDDPDFDRAPGEVFLRRTLQLIGSEGLAVGNVAVQLIGNRPRMGERRRKVELYLGDLLDASVSIAATTTDALGFTGRGEGLAAIATALLRSSRSEGGWRGL